MVCGMSLSLVASSVAFCLSMIFSDLPTPAEALVHMTGTMQRLRAGGKPVPTFREHALARTRSRLSRPAQQGSMGHAVQHPGSRRTRLVHHRLDRVCGAA